MRTKKLPAIGTEFSTKNDAAMATLGNNLFNRMMHMGETHDRYNICFMQRGESSYKKDGKKDGEKIVTGYNRIYADRVESLRANRKSWMPDMKMPVLIFTKYCKKNNPALSYYVFHGVFKVESVESNLLHLLLVISIKWFIPSFSNLQTQCVVDWPRLFKFHTNKRNTTMRNNTMK